MAENYKILYEQMKKMVEKYQDDIVPGLRRVIDRLEAERQWIRVEDRSPVPGEYVVCIAKRNPFSRFMPMVAKIEKNGWVNPITEQYISVVTHWMPLPDPQKGESGGKE